MGDPDNRDRDESGLSDKAGVVVFSRILSTIIELATMIVLVRILTKDAIAVIGFMLLMHQMARNFATFGFPESIFYYFEKVNPASRRSFAVQTIAVLGALGVLAGLLMIGLSFAAPWLLRTWSAENMALLQWLLPFFALVAALEIPTWPINNILLALDRQKHAAWYQIVMSTTMFFALVGPVIVGLGVEVAVYGLAGYAVFRFVVSAIWFQAVLPGPSEPLPKGTLRQQARFSIPLGINAFTARLNRYIDKFVVSILLSAAAFADYQVGGQEIPLITAIPYAVGSVFISRYVSYQLAGKRQALIDLWYRGVEGVALIVVPVAVLTIAVAHDIITLVFGQRYAPAVIPFQIYTVILLHRVAQYGAMLQAFADTATILKFTVVILVCNLALSIPLTLVLGISGTALATLISAGVGWILYLRRIGHHLETGLAKVLPWRIYLRVLVVAGVAGVAAWALRFTALESLPQVAALAVTVVVFGALYAGLGTAFGAIRRDHWSTAWGWVRLRFLWQ